MVGCVMEKCTWLLEEATGLVVVVGSWDLRVWGEGKCFNLDCGVTLAAEGHTPGPSAYLCLGYF